MNELKQITSQDYTSEYFAYHVWKYKSGAWANRINELLSVVNPSSQDIIADIGCGIGTLAIECAKKGSRVYAIDYSQVALDIAENLSKEIGVFDKLTFVNSSVQTIPIGDSEVSKVICADIVEHLYPKEFDSLLAESYRILRSNGTITISTPNPKHRSFVGMLPSPIIRLGRIILRKPSPDDEEVKRIQEHHEKYDKVHVDLKDVKNLKSKLMKHGFTVEKVSRGVDIFIAARAIKANTIPR